MYICAIGNMSWNAIVLAPLVQRSEQHAMPEQLPCEQKLTREHAPPPNTKRSLQLNLQQLFC